MTGRFVSGVRTWSVGEFTNYCYPELVSGSYFGRCSIKMLKQVQHDEFCG